MPTEQPSGNPTFNLIKHSGDALLAPAIPLSDLGNAQRLILRHGSGLQFVKQWGKWLAWDGKRWAEDDSCEIMRRAKDTAMAMYHAALQLPAGDEKSKKGRKSLINFAFRSQSVGALKGMIALAESEPGIPVDADALNMDPLVLNVMNGTLDLRTGKLREHSRKDRITKLAPVMYDPAAEAPQWMAFLNHVLDGDKELIDYVQRFVGYSLTGLAREQCWAILYGLGSNGKSLFLSVLRALLGEQEYARHTPSETLLATKNSERVRNDLARLQGARLVTATETESGQRLAEALVKQMTGEDPVTARFLYREYFEFVPTFKLWLAVNFTPRIRSDDPASWRRVRLIPFTVTIPDARQDKQLQGKLLTELPGIMNWALEGCLKWQRRKDGLRPPTRVTEATAQYRREMDTVGRFIEEECVTGPHEWASAADLYEKYGGWCNETGEATESQKEFGTQLRRRGFVNGKQRGIRGWQGLGLRKPDPALRVVA